MTKSKPQAQPQPKQWWFFLIIFHYQAKKNHRKAQPCYQIDWDWACLNEEALRHTLNWFLFEWFMCASLSHLYFCMQSIWNHLPTTLVRFHTYTIRNVFVYTIYRCRTWIKHFLTMKFIGFNTIKLCGKLQANNWISYHKDIR